MVNRIRKWYKKEGISVEDSFRAIDRSFNREISVKDLDVFMKECIGLKEEELTVARLNRLFKLID